MIWQHLTSMIYSQGVKDQCTHHMVGNYNGVVFNPNSTVRKGMLRKAIHFGKYITLVNILFYYYLQIYRTTSLSVYFISNVHVSTCDRFVFSCIQQ